jgi:hypothetical protein
MWVVAGLGIAGAIIVLVTSWRRADHSVSLGAVSDQWIAEHRSSGQDS